MQRKGASRSSPAGSKPSSLPSTGSRSLLKIRSMPAPQELIQQVPLFSDLDKKELQGLASTMKERTFNSGDTDANEGQTGIGFFTTDDGEAHAAVQGEERG